MGSAGALFIPVVAFLFCGFIFSCQSMDDKWKSYEKGMLARGIQVSRTPEWEKHQKQIPNVFFCLALLFFIGAMVVSYTEPKPQKSGIYRIR